jgi:copper chaperone CopZ
MKARPTFALAMILLSSIATGADAAGQTAILHLNTMMCGADPHIVRETLSKLKGVDGVEISLEKQTAIVSFDTDLVSVADIVKAAGYPAVVSN